MRSGRALTEWVTARELRLLRVFRGQLVSDAVEQLHVALLGILLKGGNKGPGHGPSGLRGDRGVGTNRALSVHPILLEGSQGSEADGSNEKEQLCSMVFRRPNATRRLGCQATTLAVVLDTQGVQNHVQE